jgi:L-ascorbate metabolism protein UlaG (beta-lactamase superfamily)
MTVKSWFRGTLGAILLLIAGLGGYAAWALGDPPMPPGSQILPAGAPRPGGVTVHYFGTTTLAFSDGRNAVMIDALLTRPTMATALFGKIASAPATIDADLKQAGLTRLDLLLVSHSHYDHALDVAAVAQRTGARVVGSASTREIALGGGVPEARITTVRGGATFEAGDFRVTVIRSLHSLGDRVPGGILAPLRQPAPLKDYKAGGTFAFLIEHKGLRLLVHASANVLPGQYRGIKADVVFLATGGLSTQPEVYTANYWHEIVEATGAKLVVPIHWDDFFTSLDRPLKPLPRMMDDIPLTMKRIAPLAARDTVAIRTLPVIAGVDIAAAVAQGR